MLISTIELLKHIRDEALFLEANTHGLAADQFVSDPVLTRACIRAIEIMGEASKRSEMASSASSTCRVEEDGGDA